MLNILKNNIFGQNERRGKYCRAMWVMMLIFSVFPLFTTGTYYINLVTNMMVFGIMAVGLDILAGYLGLGTLGHAAFFGAASYCAGVLSGRLALGFFPTLFLTMLVGFALSVLFAMMTTKISGISFMMVNLALCQVIWGVAYRWTSFTGGDNGLGGIPRPVIFGYTFTSPTSFYYLVFFFLAVVVFFLFRLVNSPYGLTLIGIRNSPKRMRALGFNVYWHRFIAYVFSGSVAALAGILMAYYNQFVSPQSIHVTTSSKVYLMVLVGGVSTLLGPVIGASLVVLLENYISTITQRWVMILGAMYVLCVMFSPQGIVGLINSTREMIRSRKFKSQTQTGKAENAPGEEPSAAAEEEYVSAASLSDKPPRS